MPQASDEEPAATLESIQNLKIVLGAEISDVNKNRVMVQLDGVNSTITLIQSTLSGLVLGE